MKVTPLKLLLCACAFLIGVALLHAGYPLLLVFCMVSFMFSLFVLLNAGLVERNAKKAFMLSVLCIAAFSGAIAYLIDYNKTQRWDTSAPKTIINAQH